MPDWSYHTILRPALFQLPPEQARTLTLKTIGTLGSNSLGRALIDLMGHMHPSQELQCSALGLTFPSVVGLGAGLDIEGTACNALARFGFGFLEVGPVTRDPICSTEPIERLDQAIRYPDISVNQGCERLVTQLERNGPHAVPLGIRLGYRPGADALEAANERSQLIQRLASFADFFVLECHVWDANQWAEHLAIVTKAQADSAVKRPILINVRPDLDPQQAKQLIDVALKFDIHGVVISGGCSEADKRLVGMPTRQQSLQMVNSVASEYGNRVTIIGSGGILEPRDALVFLDAGATLIQIHSGLIYSGPGLPKRINEAVAYRSDRAKVSSSTKTIPPWIWIALLGLGLIISGAIVWVVAVTQTVLPYDEAFIGLSRADLIAINARLLPFMAHDRATVAGTMLSTGVLYLGLAVGGIRRGYGWARQAVSASAIAGFLSFFLFLGFGYFDPLHAVLTAGLVPLLILGMRGKMPQPVPAAPPNLTNTRQWFTGLWGQFLFVMIGIGLIGAGTTIATVGMTSVFVPEDLHFLQTSADVLRAVNSHLVPLIAHDRAGFGGNLISIGLAVLLLSLWGFRQGERWIWWTLALGGLPGFIAAVGIHLAVGYLDLGHLFPAFFALLLFGIGLVLAAPYLLRREKPGMASKSADCAKL